MEWHIQAIRGATTVAENSVAAMREAVHELLDALESNNPIRPNHVISATFSATRDLDVVFPAAIARERAFWANVPLLDVQQMHVEDSLERCIRCLVHVSTPAPGIQVYHPYLRQAKQLRPDLDLVQAHP